MAIDVSAWNAAADQINNIQGVAQYNNAWSAGQANAQNQFQIQQNAKAMAFNRAEAAKNRDWQEYMSNTAHQREVADLRAAGLNPILSAMNGNGAAVTSGATAQGVTSAGAKGDTDESVNAAIANVLSSVLSADTTLKAADINAKTQEAVADKYNAMSQIVANINAETSRYAADKHYEGALESAAASRYGAYMGYKTVSDYPGLDRALANWLIESGATELGTQVGKTGVSALGDLITKGGNAAKSLWNYIVNVYHKNFTQTYSVNQEKQKNGSGNKF